MFLHPPQPYPGGHGYHHQVDIVVGSFRGTINAESYEGVEALRSFRDRLVALHRTLNGEASLAPWYNNLRLSVKGDGLGHMLVEGDVVGGDRREIQLTFSFTVDQTHLPEAIAALDRLFPE